MSGIKKSVFVVDYKKSIFKSGIDRIALLRCISKQHIQEIKVSTKNELVSTVPVMLSRSQREALTELQHSEQMRSPLGETPSLNAVARYVVGLGLEALKQKDQADGN